jgi:FkbM family methyltransferase
MHSYSQFGEDKIIQDFFPIGYKGVCIDVGATNGIGQSNSYHFEKQGWMCICCEANPNMYEKLKMNRHNAIHCAVGAEDKLEVEFNIVTLNGQGGEQSAISGVRIDQRLYDDHLFLQPVVKKINVPMMTLNTILLKYPAIDKIDFMSIDVEGTEIDVMKGFDVKKWMPTLIVLENNYNDKKYEEYMSSVGYKKELRNVVNDFYTIK